MIGGDRNRNPIPMTAMMRNQALGLDSEIKAKVSTKSVRLITLLKAMTWRGFWLNHNVNLVEVKLMIEKKY